MGFALGGHASFSAWGNGSSTAGAVHGTPTGQSRDWVTDIGIIAVASSTLIVIGGIWMPHSEAAFMDDSQNAANSIATAYWSSAVSIDAGGSRTCIVTFDGAAWCAGLNDRGQLGDGSTVSSPSPVQVVGVGGTVVLTGLDQIAVGATYSCANDTSGAAFCWGRDDKGQLGDNTATDSPTPVQVVGVGAIGTLDNIIDIANGATFCWGLNDKSQLGDNTTTNSPTPVQVIGIAGTGTGTLTDATITAAGTSHGRALLQPTGTVTCWGNNTNGEGGLGWTPGAVQPFPLISAL